MESFNYQEKITNELELYFSLINEIKFEETHERKQFEDLIIKIELLLYILNNNKKNIMEDNTRYLLSRLDNKKLKLEYIFLSPIL